MIGHLYDETTYTELFELIYPVGIIIELATNANPKDLFGIGEWEQIKDRFILAAGDDATVGDTGGASTVTLSIANIPTHTHTRGTMDITGKIRCYSDYNYKNDEYWTNGVSGPFYKGYSNYDEEIGSSNNQSASATSDAVRTVSFQASRAWTGETSSVGEGKAFSNMPPYYVAYLWRRVS